MIYQVTAIMTFISTQVDVIQGMKAAPAPVSQGGFSSLQVQHRRATQGDSVLHGHFKTQSSEFEAWYTEFGRAPDDYTILGRAGKSSYKGKAKTSKKAKAAAFLKRSWQTRYFVLSKAKGEKGNFLYILRYYEKKSDKPGKAAYALCKHKEMHPEYGVGDAGTNNIMVTEEEAVKFEDKYQARLNIQFYETTRSSTTLLEMCFPTLEIRGIFADAFEKANVDLARKERAPRKEPAPLRLSSRNAPLPQEKINALLKYIERVPVLVGASSTFSSSTAEDFLKGLNSHKEYKKHNITLQDVKDVFLALDYNSKNEVEMKAALRESSYYDHVVTLGMMDTFVRQYNEKYGLK